jgi:hypothetical protein
MKKTLFCFIVGVEKCGTTSLANYLVNNKMAAPLVPNIKEARLFKKFRALIYKNIDRNLMMSNRVPLLEASVSSLEDPNYLQMIDQIAKEYKIIVCLRNQFERTVSAFNFYKSWNSEKLSPTLQKKLLLEIAYKNLPEENEYNNLQGHYIHSWFNCQDQMTRNENSLDRFDRYIEEFNNSSFQKRVSYEIRYLNKENEFPRLSILSNSFYSWKIRLMLKIVDPARVMIISESFLKNMASYSAEIADFLDVDPPKNSITEQRNVGTSKSAINNTEINLVKNFLAKDFLKDTEELLSILNQHESINTALFNPNDLFHKAS